MKYNPKEEIGQEAIKNLIDFTKDKPTYKEIQEEILKEVFRE